MITGLLYRELESTQRLDLARFYGRRIRRLLPAAALVLAVTFAGFWLIYSPVERQRLGAVSLATALYVSNVWFALYATDYLGGDADSNPLLHTWSLAVEEQFYLVWPCALLLMARFTRIFDLRKRVVVGITLVSIASFASALIVIGISQPWAFFGSPTRVWEFGAGALAYFACRRDWGWRASVRVALAAAGFLLVIASAFVLNEDSLMPGFAALACVGGAAAIIVGRRVSRRPRRALVSRDAVNGAAGRPLLRLVPVALARAGRNDAETSQPQYTGKRSGTRRVAAACPLMYRAFENPIRHSAFLSSRPAASIALGAAITFVCSSVAYVERDRAQASALAADQVAIQRAQMDVPQILQRSGCHADILQTRVPADCRFGTRDSSVTIALFGDSHAEHWFPTLEKIAADRGWSLLSLQSQACLFPSSHLLQSLMASYRDVPSSCDKALRAIIDSKPRLVVMANSYAYERFEYEGVSRAEAWARGLDRALREFAQARIDALLLRDTPVAPFDVPTCLSRAAARDDPSGARCRFDRSLQLESGNFRSGKQDRDDARGVRVADLTTAVCPEPLCAVVRNATPIYSDRSHMTTAFAAALAPALYDHVVQEVQSDSASTPSTRN